MKRREKLRSQTFTSIAAGITKKGYNVEEAFKAFDANKDGKVTFQELEEGFAKMGVRIAKRDVVATFQILDEDCNQTISLVEFSKELDGILKGG